MIKLHRSPQVSQAILLDQFIATASSTIAEEERARRLARRKEQLIHNTLDPLMEKLTEDYIDDGDLSHRLQDLFKASLPSTLADVPADVFTSLQM